MGFLFREAFKIFAPQPSYDIFGGTTSNKSKIYTKITKAMLYFKLPGELMVVKCVQYFLF